MPNGSDLDFYRRIADLETEHEVNKVLWERNFREHDEVKDELKECNKKLARLEKILIAVAGASIVGGGDAAMNLLALFTGN